MQYLLNDNNPAGNYMFKAKNINIRTRCEINKDTWFLDC